MDIIETTRELGKMIQKDSRYIEYVKAKEENDRDEALQGLIGKFNLKRADLNFELSKPDKNPEKLKELDVEIKNLYSQIMENEKMIAYNNAKNAMDDLLSQINNIITMSANGEDPETCSTQAGCNGSCSGCSGCN